MSLLLSGDEMTKRFADVRCFSYRAPMMACHALGVNGAGGIDDGWGAVGMERVEQQRRCFRPSASVAHVVTLSARKE
jgi:hypothetical protein